MTSAVGVDVGGTKIAAGVVEDDGRIIEMTRRPSPSSDPTRLVDAIVDAVEELRGRHEVSAVAFASSIF